MRFTPYGELLRLYFITYLRIKFYFRYASLKFNSLIKSVLTLFAISLRRRFPSLPEFDTPEKNGLKNFSYVANTLRKKTQKASSRAPLYANPCLFLAFSILRALFCGLRQKIFHFTPFFLSRLRSFALRRCFALVLNLFCAFAMRYRATQNPFKKDFFCKPKSEHLPARLYMGAYILFY